MTGSRRYLLNPTKNFESGLKKLQKKHYKGKRTQQVFQAFIVRLVEELCLDPYPVKSALEAIPRKVTLPEGVTFHKLRFPMPGLQGASGEGRLMYLVDAAQAIIVLVWIYTHAEFAKRPGEQELAAQLRESMTLASEAADLSPPDNNDNWDDTPNTSAR